MIPLAALQYLDSLINHELFLDQARAASFKLDRVRELLKELGGPHQGLTVVHVAGSKGKGSICAIISSILQHAGYRVGLYTSPHLYHYRERIRVLEPGSSDLQRTPGGRLGNEGRDIFPDCIREDELAAAVGAVKPAVEKIRAREGLGGLSFFEVYTALALYYFRERDVDLAVLETGLGGRLDATNAVQSILAVIAPISLEHTHILGDTIKQIAGEKAGIIKDRGQKVVIAPQCLEAMEVLKKRCREFQIDPLEVENTVEYEDVAQDIGGQSFVLTTKRKEYGRVHLPLLGKHQRENAATAISAVECLSDLGFAVTQDALREGCKDVFWPGRLEVAGREPLILLDGAHNAASAQALSETVREILGGKKVVLVLGLSKDKDQTAICGELQPIAREVIFTKARHPRASDLQGAVDVRTALDLARAKAGRDDAILVTGSVFVVSEARRYLLLNKKMEDGKVRSVDVDS